MAFDAHKNFSYSTVATAPSPASSGTTLIVAGGDGAKFPAAPFNATVWPANTQPSTTNAEIVRVTAISTDTFTITRSQESSSARAITSGDQIMAGITAKTLTDVEAAAGLLHTVAASGASQTINYSTASTWDITLTANCTFTLSGFTSGDPDFLTLILRQDATGSRTVTWPTITWIGSGVAPTLQTAASSVDSVVLFSFDGGTTVFGVAQTSSSGVASGTSFPASPTDGQRFYRSDRNLDYFYKLSITKWLTVGRFEATGGLFNVSANGGVFIFPLDNDIYLESFVVEDRVATTNDASNFWTVKLYGESTAGAATMLTSYSTSADTLNNHVVHNVAYNAVIAATTYADLLIQPEKTGAPGGIAGGTKLIYRLVG